MTADIVNLADYRAARAEATARSQQEVMMEDAIAICLARREVLTPWEEHFLVSIRRSYPDPSPKQRTVLQSIFDRVCGAAEENDAS